MFIIQKYKMSCSHIWEFVRNKCKSCFNNTKNPIQNSRIQSSLIEMEEVKQSYEKQTPLDSSVVKIVDLKQPLLQSSKINNEKRRGVRKISIVKQLDEESNGCKEDEFHSIDSSMNIQTERSMMSSKALITHLDKIKKKKPTSKKKESLFHSYTSSEWQQTPELQRINVDQEIDNFKDWLKQEYGKTRVVSFRINHAVRLRMQGTAMFTLLMHKLEDFKVNCMNESSAQINNCFSNKSNTLICQFHNEKGNISNYNKSKIISYFFIKCNADNVALLLSVLTSKEAFRIMYGFSCSQAVEYEGENLKMPFPIIQVRYNNGHVKDSRTYHLATQVIEMGEPKQQFRDVVEIGYSLDECEQSWQRVVKIVFSFLSEVEIYCESFEEVLGEESFFLQKFRAMQQYLTRLGLIPAN